MAVGKVSKQSDNLLCCEISIVAFIVVTVATLYETHAPQDCQQSNLISKSYSAALQLTVLAYRWQIRCIRSSPWILVCLLCTTALTVCQLTVDLDSSGRTS